METLKRNIAIVCGGDSSEHDVSMRSAQGLYSFFDKERYNIYVVDVKGQDWHVDLQNGDTAKIDKNDFSFKKDGKTVTFDYAYITIHGTPGENGLMQGYFELLHIPYSTSGVLVEAMTFDKYVLNNDLRGFGVNVAESVLLRRGEEDKYSDEEIEKRIGMPCFVKPAADGSSFGVSKVKNADQLAPALRVAFMESDEVMVESFMKGTEISIGCYKTRDKAVVFPATEVVTSNEFSTTMPSITARCRRSLPPVSHPRQQSVWRRRQAASMTSCIATASFVSTTSSPRMPTATTRSTCLRSTPHPA